MADHVLACDWLQSHSRSGAERREALDVGDVRWAMEESRIAGQIAASGRQV